MRGTVWRLQSARRRNRKHSGIDQKRICVALLADAGQTTVSWIDDRFVGQLQQLAAQRVRDLVHRTAPQIGAANAACKKRVARKKAWSGNGDRAGVLWQIEAHAARRVSGSVHDVGLERTPTQCVAL